MDKSEKLLCWLIFSGITSLDLFFVSLLSLSLFPQILLSISSNYIK